jgi:hypothetical protein
MISISTRPPTYVAVSPIASPISSATVVAAMPTGQADPQPVEDRRKHVATLIVGAEPVRAAGR